MFVKQAVTIACLGALAWSLPSHACSCRPEPGDLPTQLRAALKESRAVYRGKVVARKKTFFSRRDVAIVRVLEVFKGSAKVGEELELAAGGLGDCTIYFFDGTEYLLYGHNDDPSKIHLCSRTRALNGGDRELEWLRTGTLPPVPVALQRQTVHCERCSLETVAPALAGTVSQGDCDTGLEDEAALKAAREGRPFWTAQYYGPDSSHRSAFGIGWQTTDAGARIASAFELIQTPDRAATETCNQKVVRRSCEKLEPVTKRRRGGAAVSCANPGLEEVVCDETRTRESEWGPLEKPAVAQCKWENPEWPMCKLSETSDPLDAGVAETPLLRCRPFHGWRTQWNCHVVMEAGTDTQSRPESLPLEY